MSRSNPMATNPATRFFQWSGGVDKVIEKVVRNGKEVSQESLVGGKVVYYDKELAINVEVEMPFTFLVLDQLNTITGFNESTNSGYWANEVRDLQNQELVVRTKIGGKPGIFTRGTYAEIKDEVKANGGKFTKSVYIAYKDDQGELAIGNIKIAGASMGPWIEFTKKYDVERCAVMITDVEFGKKGKVDFAMPVFEGREVQAATEKEASALDEQLQRYLSVYLSRKPGASDVSDDSTVEDEDEPTRSSAIEDAGEVENLGDRPQKASKTATEPDADDSDEGMQDTGTKGQPINISNVPF